MPSKTDSSAITGKIHLQASPDQVFTLLATNDGRALFWAESAMEYDKVIHFVFPDEKKWRGEILANEPPSLFSLRYCGGSTATFRLEDDGNGGTLLTLSDEGVAETDQCEVTAGWVSVLLALKAAADFNIDLRNHNAARSWEQGFVDN